MKITDAMVKCVACASCDTPRMDAEGNVTEACINCLRERLKGDYDISQLRHMTIQLLTWKWGDSVSKCHTESADYDELMWKVWMTNRSYARQICDLMEMRNADRMKKLYAELLADLNRVAGEPKK